MPHVLGHGGSFSVAMMSSRMKTRACQTLNTTLSKSENHCETWCDTFGHATQRLRRRRSNKTLISNIHGTQDPKIQADDDKKHWATEKLLRRREHGARHVNAGRHFDLSFFARALPGEYRRQAVQCRLRR